MSDSYPPQAIVIAGPNGAGKSTAASALIPVGIDFVNADDIARGLPARPGESVEILAGRIMIERLEELQQQRTDFAIETTLASRSLVPRLIRLKNDGYRMTLMFLWMPDAELCIQRVAERVRRGGHHIPEETIRRRFKAGIKNFFELYRVISDEWQLFDNTRIGRLSLIAEGSGESTVTVHQDKLWSTIQEGAKND
ncbi:MAG: zeta toxin family protein [Armatimonadota bacterium]|nr:zeta toxin family protein [Armatimonadota bacterium]